MVITMLTGGSHPMPIPSATRCPVYPQAIPDARRTVPVMSVTLDYKGPKCTAGVRCSLSCAVPAIESHKQDDQAHRRLWLSGQQQVLGLLLQSGWVWVCPVQYWRHQLLRLCAPGLT